MAIRAPDGAKNIKKESVRRWKVRQDVGRQKDIRKEVFKQEKAEISKMKSSGRSFVRSRPSKAVGAQFCRNLPPTLSHTFSATFSHTCHISIYFCLGKKC